LWAGKLSWPSRLGFLGGSASSRVRHKAGPAMRAPDPRFADAIAFSIDSETEWSRDADGEFGIHHLDPAPWNRLLGPLHDRGPVTGVIRLDGEEVAQWGDPHRADLSFSVAKTYLALLAGVAFDRGLLERPDEPVRL